MKVVRHTLVSEGMTDANLIPIIDWTLREVAHVELATGVRAEFWRLRSPPRSLADKLVKAAELFPCDILFVHRDSDRESPVHRYEEMQNAVETANKAGCVVPAVAVVPVRMLEAWLLFDERAIRCAAGNPSGTAPLDLPHARRVEERPDPKSDLRKALRTASELKGRRLKKFNSAQAFWRVLDFVEDFSPLRQLPAYCSFEASVREMSSKNWRPGFYRPS
jgi:hypothetical protein